MKIYKLKEMHKGWFIGDFEPTAYSTKDFEASYRTHHKGEKWDVHYHKVGTEINLLVSGKMSIQNKTLNSGDIFIIHPYELANPVFFEDCEVICIKTPSAPSDKFVVNEEKNDIQK